MWAMICWMWHVYMRHSAGLLIRETFLSQFHNFQRQFRQQTCRIPTGEGFRLLICVMRISYVCVHVRRHSRYSVHMGFYTVYHTHSHTLTHTCSATSIIREHTTTNSYIRLQIMEIGHYVGVGCGVVVNRFFFNMWRVRLTCCSICRTCNTHTHANT